MSYCLVDLNQVLIANVMQAISNPAFKVPDTNGNLVSLKTSLDEDLLRHMCLNTIRSQVKQWKSNYPNVVLCCDNRHYWRRDVFPFYKAHRKADRDASGLDWNLIFNALNKIRDELKVYAPYHVLDVEGAEADDVIAVLTARLSANNPVLILSSDKDFGQLQKYNNVKQYSPIMKRFISIDNPTTFIKEHVMRGDRGDGIPNFLSSDNCIVAGERQKPISSKKLADWIAKDPTEFCNDEMLRGYKRNQTLVDFDYIPLDVQQRIVEAFENSKPATKQQMLDYFIEKGLKTMIESLSDF